MKSLNSVFAFAVLLILTACNSRPDNETKTQENTRETTQQFTPLVQEVLTKAQRDALTPDEVLATFKEGNERFVKNDLTARDHSAQVRKSANGQFPKAAVRPVGKWFAKSKHSLIL